MNFLDSIWLIPLFPLLGAAVMLLIGRKLPKSVISILCPGTIFISFLFSVGAVAQLAASANKVHEVIQFLWMPPLHADWGFLIDPLSSVMILVVTGVGFLIHVYAVGYMGHEGGFYRFFGYLNLFVFFMLMLVLANNYLLLFVGWEGVGLCSYLLIGFYFEKKKAGDAGKKAFIVNRIGDAAFIIGMLLIFQITGSLRFTQVNEFIESHHLSAETLAWGILSTTALMLFIGATGKSAQFPLHIWLPDAMEGPTPVSALIHAATMVTAGVYMVCRSHVLFELTPMTMQIVAVVGAFTAIFAASIALVQTDIPFVYARFLQGSSIPGRRQRYPRSWR
jgi:NADH-quinone oxidoreductase subunit L